MDGVEAQAVQAKLRDPVGGVLHHEIAYSPRARPVVVDRLPPLVGMTIRDIEVAVDGQVIAVWTEVVVDHIQNHAEIARMRGVDEALERVRVAVDMRRREE